MRAAYYETNGSAREVLHVGDVETGEPGRGEVRVRLRTSGVNPSDVKSRAGLSRKIAFPRVIPQSDGAGEIDRVGEGVPASRIGERVWVWNGQWRRAFGTAAEHIVLPAEQAVPAAGQHQPGGRRLPRHPGLHRLSGRRICRHRRGLDRAGGGRRRRGRALRHPACQEEEGDGPHHRQFARQGRACPAGGRRPRHRLQARGRRRARHGDHRQARRRRGDRDGSRRQRQAAAGRAAAGGHRRDLWRQRAGAARSRSSSCCRTASRSGSSWSI